MSGRISIEDGQGVIRLNKAQIRGLRVALRPCPCKSNKSAETARIREWLAKKLAEMEARL